MFSLVESLQRISPVPVCLCGALVTAGPRPRKRLTACLAYGTSRPSCQAAGWPHGVSYVATPTPESNDPSVAASRHSVMRQANHNSDSDTAAIPKARIRIAPSLHRPALGKGSPRITWLLVYHWTHFPTGIHKLRDTLHNEAHLLPKSWWCMAARSQSQTFTVSPDALSRK